MAGELNLQILRNSVDRVLVLTVVLDTVQNHVLRFEKECAVLVPPVDFFLIEQRQHIHHLCRQQVLAAQNIHVVEADTIRIRRDDTLAQEVPTEGGSIDRLGQTGLVDVQNVLHRGQIDNLALPLFREAVLRELNDAVLVHTQVDFVSAVRMDNQLIRHFQRDRITADAADKSCELRNRNHCVHILTLNLVRTNFQRVCSISGRESQNIVLHLDAHHARNRQELVFRSAFHRACHHVLKLDGGDCNFLTHYFVLLKLFTR